MNSSYLSNHALAKSMTHATWIGFPHMHLTIFTYGLQSLVIQNCAFFLELMSCFNDQTTQTSSEGSVDVQMSGGKMEHKTQMGKKEMLEPKRQHKIHTFTNGIILEERRRVDFH
jgi:hypothetical protein